MDDYNNSLRSDDEHSRGTEDGAPETAPLENEPLREASDRDGEYHFTANELNRRHDGAGEEQDDHDGASASANANNGYYAGPAQPPFYGQAPQQGPQFGSYQAPGYGQYPDWQQNRYAYPAGNPGQSEKKGKGGKILLAVLAAVALLVAGFLIKTIIDHRGQTPETTPSRAASDSEGNEPINNLDEAETKATPKVEVTVGADKTLDATEIYKKILPSSVGILVYSKSSNDLLSEGSGVIYQEDNDGEYTYIVTCAHVIKGRNQIIMVQLSSDETEIRAEVVGYDSRTDIGVIRIKKSGLTAIEIGDSDQLVVGETVYAIGNPGGTEFAFTFTNGIVTALARPVSSSSTGYTMECIQHNVAINPGNSGGALVNRFGQLIGINSMKIVAADYEGMGFAVPSSVFVKVINEIVANGYVTSRPKIGISYVKASDEQVYAMFVAIKDLPAGSIVVANISEDSDFYGKLKKGDLITEINGKKLDSASDLAEFVESMKVGDTIRLHVVHINRDYSYEEEDITGKLVEDIESAQADSQEEEDTTSYFDDYFDYYDGEDDYDDYDDFDEFYRRFFGGQ